MFLIINDGCRWLSAPCSSRFIFYDGLHFAAVFRHIVQEELYFSIHIGNTKVAICSVGIKNIVQNFVLCSKNIMFALHNEQGV